MGLTYILSAYTTTPVVGFLRRRFGLSSRGVLGLLMAALAALCVIPITLARLPVDEGTRRGVQVTGLWCTVILYNTLTGVLWPIVKSYIAGGRRGQDLVRTMGFWNVVWCSAAIPATIVSAPWSPSPPTPPSPGWSSCTWPAWPSSAGTRPSPSPTSTSTSPTPPVSRLLLAFRMLMPMGYMVLTTLTPMLGDMFGAG